MSELPEEIALDQVVSLSLQDMPEATIAKTLGLSRYRVNKLVNSEAYKKRLNEIRSEAIQTSAAIFLKEVAGFRDLALKALKKNLQDQNLEAVKAWAKYVGIDSQEKEAAKDTSLTIVMPGAAPAEKQVPSITVKEGEEV